MGTRQRTGALIAIRQDEGIAAITVLLIIAVVGSLGAMVLFAVNQDLGFVRVDSTAARSGDLAEAGLDLAAEYLFINQLSGSGALGSTVTTVSNTAADASRFESGTFAFILDDRDEDKGTVTFRVISEAAIGRPGTSLVRTLLRQSNEVTILDLPFGMFVDGNVDFGGNPKLFNMSVLVNGSVTNRDKVSFDQNENGLLDDQDQGWLFHQKFVTATAFPPEVPNPPNVPSFNMCGDFFYQNIGATVTVGCSAVFASGQIFLTGGGAGGTEEHAASLNPFSACDPPANAGCAADRDSHQSAGPPVVSVPGDALVPFLPILRRISQQQGLYRDTRGQGGTVNFNDGDYDAGSGPGHKHFQKNLIFFFEGDAGQNIGLKANIIPGDMQGGGSPDCSFFVSAATEAEEVCADSGLIIVLNANFALASGVYWSGAAYVPQGELKMAGGVTFVGTMFVKKFASSGGSNTLILEPDWFGRIPAGFRQITRSRWAECESFQTC